MLKENRYLNRTTITIEWDKGNQIEITLRFSVQHTTLYIYTQDTLISIDIYSWKKN